MTIPGLVCGGCPLTGAVVSDSSCQNTGRRRGVTAHNTTLPAGAALSNLYDISFFNFCGYLICCQKYNIKLITAVFFS